MPGHTAAFSFRHRTQSIRTTETMWCCGGALQVCTAVADTASCPTIASTVANKCS